MSRAIVTAQSRAFVERGEAVVCLDYFGTGDSEGELDQTHADLWMHDIGDILAWIRDQGAASISLWGLRFGGLLAMQFVADNPDVSVERMLLWKPVINGKVLMGQFFRLKQVSESMKGGNKINWMARVVEGETVEIAGYPISTPMLQSVTAMTLKGLTIEPPPVTIWLEVAAQKIAASVDALRPLWQDHKLTVQPVTAPAFWQNPDCYQAPELLQQTLQATELGGR